MANYVVQGKLGTGKGKYGVMQVQRYLRRGCRVATNFDLYLEHLMPASDRSTVVRVPDKPTLADLEMLGHGSNGSYDEERNGLLLLDELGSWLNAREYQDKTRKGFIDWLIHSRKKGWDVYLIVQNLKMIDNQVREGLVEYSVKLMRADKLKVPVLGHLLPGKYGKLPKFHIANISMIEMPGFVIDRDWFIGKDLQPAYDTFQIFRDWARDPKQPGFMDETLIGPHSLLSAWHLKGRHQQPNKPARTRQLPPKVPLAQLLQRLPADRRVYWSQRLIESGAL